MCINHTFLIAIVFTIITSLACIDDAQATEPNPLDLYIASGISISNTEGFTLGERSYPSGEIGISSGGLSLALVTGRSDNDYSDKEVLENYWWELKTAAMVSAGNFDVYGLLGIGNYVSTNQVFIEYGVGFSRAIGNVSYFAQVSNWDNLWYITPGLMYNF